jgi:ribonuclease HI
LSEALKGKANLRNSIPLTGEEENWIKEFITNNSGNTLIPLTPIRSWEIRLEEQEFLLWRETLNEWCLFFDGASKGNPGQAGGGGIILDPSGIIHTVYAWGLGHATNNQAEFLALWQGLRQALNLGIESIRIFGDSKQVLETLILKKTPKDCSLAQLYRKSAILFSQFKDSQIHHVLRNLNGQADAQANIESFLSKGRLKVNEETYSHAIP